MMKIPENSLRIYLKKSNHLDVVIKKFISMRRYAEQHNLSEKEFGEFGDTIFMFFRSRYSSEILNSMLKLSDLGFYSSGDAKFVPSEIKSIFWDVLEPRLEKIKTQIPLRKDSDGKEN